MFNREHRRTNIKHLQPFQRTLPSFEELVTSILRPKNLTHSPNSSQQPISPKSYRQLSCSTGSSIAPTDSGATYHHSSNTMKMGLIGCDTTHHSFNFTPQILIPQPIGILPSHSTQTSQILPIPYLLQEFPLSLHNNTFIRYNAVGETNSLISTQIDPPPSKVHVKGKHKYTCKICQRSFTTSGHMARHNRIHTGERKHLCPWPGCVAKFSRQDNCMQHYKTHKNRKRRSKIVQEANCRTIDK